MEPALVACLKLRESLFLQLSDGVLLSRVGLDVVEFEARLAPYLLSEGAVLNEFELLRDRGEAAVERGVFPRCHWR